jgi:hypothetical protein
MSQSSTEIQRKEATNFLVDFLSDLIVTVILKYKNHSTKKDKT